MAIRHVLLGGALIALVAGCATPTDGDAATSTPVASTPAAVAGNGALYTSAWTDGQATVNRHGIGADGSVGPAAALLTEPADDTAFPGIIDGLGDLAVTGSFAQYWTTDLQLRDAATGALRSEVSAPRWCGGEGLTYAVCVLLDDTRLARTSELGGELSAEPIITISSLATGETLDELGPFPGLSMVMGTSDPGTLLLVTVDGPWTDDPVNAPGTVLSLDVASARTTELGSHPADWVPVCPIGTDSVLGYLVGDVPTAEVVGSAGAAAFSWEEADSVVGCSADGSHLYLQRIPQPPGEGTDDEEPANPPTTVDVISVADGARSQAAVLDPGVFAGPTSR
jgi:hypothetical protein